MIRQLDAKFIDETDMAFGESMKTSPNAWSFSTPSFTMLLEEAAVYPPRVQ